MDKIRESSINNSHSFSVSDRKTIIISGVIKIENFDKEEFQLETTLGIMNIKGEELELIKLDTYQGNISIRGRINQIVYLDDVKKEESFISRLFK